MNEKGASEAEQRIREAFVDGNMERAASATLQAYGNQIFSFVASRLHNQSNAQDAFSMFAEHLWAGLPNFSWRCSMRTWCYTIARNAVIRFATTSARRGVHCVPLSFPGVLSNMVDQLRSATHEYQQTAVKDRFRALREQLDPDDQMLLVLRVDRELSWQDLAITMNGDVDMPAEQIARESARLRKAFERLKRQLRELAEREGLLGPEE